MQHSFDISIAEKYGVNIAIFLNNMAFWIKKNQANNKHFHNGRYWTYNSSKALSELFPYWSDDQMDRLIKKCIELELLLTDNFNETTYDRTRWFSLTDKALELYNITIPRNRGMDSAKSLTPFREIAEPITDIKPDIKPDNKSLCATDVALAKSSFEIFWANYQRKKDKARAFRVWCQKKLWQQADEIMMKLIQQNSYDAQYQTIQFIPHPTNYLRNQRWEDEITSIKIHPVTSVLNDIAKDFHNLSADEQKSLIDFMH